MSNNGVGGYLNPPNPNLYHKEPVENESTAEERNVSSKSIQQAASKSSQQAMTSEKLQQEKAAIGSAQEVLTMHVAPAFSGERVGREEGIAAI